MKTPLLRAVSRPARASGVALVAVLAILVLVVGIAVAMLTMAGTERRSASVFLNSAGARVMADNAVGIVQAQINQATTGGSKVAWASQPGMVRTYNEQGVLQTAYKLYSAATMTRSGTDVSKIAPTSEDLPPNNWASSPSLWTDLNAPVSVLNLETSTASNPQYTSVFPIVDPEVRNLLATQRPEGFSIDDAKTPGTTTAQPAPMPVRWLYVLQNGTIISPDDATSTGTKLAFTGTVPSTANPIVGRVAFWTDDDSCKVNVNTASGGGPVPTSGANGPDSLWDTPHFYTVEDVKFATSQPINGEFQRYPGHPAMTSLSAVFPHLNYEQILSTITPRYQSITSGSNRDSNQGAYDTYKQNSSLGGSLATPASGPLYANANEVIFQPNAGQRAINPNLSKSVVQKAEFFLTSDSRAPEINLFNLPRIACWPISADSTSGRSVFDKTIAFNSTIGNYEYYFQRRSALDAGLGSANADIKITRNQTIFSYLHSLTGRTIPGFNSRAQLV